jgi:hypothetical protein
MNILKVYHGWCFQLFLGFKPCLDITKYQNAIDKTQAQSAPESSIGDSKGNGKRYPKKIDEGAPEKGNKQTVSPRG